EAGRADRAMPPALESARKVRRPLLPRLPLVTPWETGEILSPSRSFTGPHAPFIVVTKFGPKSALVIGEPLSTVEAPMSISYRDIVLRSARADDLDFLFPLFCDPTRAHLWMRSRRVFDEREFHEGWHSWIAQQMAARFIVEAGGRPVGLVY